MKSKEIRTLAHLHMMKGLQTAMIQESNLPLSESDLALFNEEIIKQFRRIEKMLGFEPGHWTLDLPSSDDR